MPLIAQNTGFSAADLTAAINEVKYRPSYLLSLGIFEPRPIFTETALFDFDGQTLSLIQTSKRGAPVESDSDKKRSRVPMMTRRIVKKQRILASELLGVIGRDGVSLETLGERVARAQTKAQNKVLLTAENHMLTALTGVSKDADGSPLDNFATVFNKTIPTATNFDLGNTATDVEGKCATVVRTMLDNSDGAIAQGARIVGIAGNGFFDAFRANAKYREVVKSNPQASASLLQGFAYQSFNYGGIEFVNYRSGSGVNVGDKECRFVPVGAEDCFSWVQSPGERFEDIGTEGQPFYSWLEEDPNSTYVDVCVASYPLFVCQRPAILASGTTP